MKNLTLSAALALLLPVITRSQTVIPITATTNTSALPAGNRTCSNCIFNITPGVTLNVDAAGSWTNVTFNGGTVNFQIASALNTTCTFNNDTVLINANMSIQSMNCYNDSVAINNTFKFTKGVTEIANSRISINAAATFVSANLVSDSIHLTSGSVSFTGNPDSVSDSHITVENGTSWAFSKPIISNSTIALAANSTLTTGSVTASDTYFFADGATTLLKINGASTFTNSNLLLTNGATASNTSATTFTGGAIDASGSSVFSPGSAINITDAAVNFSGSSKFKTTSALTFTGSTLTMSGSATMPAGAAIDFESTTVNLDGTASIATPSAITVGTGSDLTVGDGSGAASVTGSTINVTGGSFLGVAPHASITVSSGKLNKTTGTSYSVSGNTLFGCATFDDSQAPQACTTLALGNIVLHAAEKSASQVYLSWTDAEQTPAYRYLIQRSTDNDSWSTVATITANAYGAGEYAYTDADAPAGKLFYRIERIDANNTQVYSPISTVTIENNISAAPITIHPNPATQGYFYLSAPETDAMIVNVYTTTGQILLHTALQGQTQYPIRLPSSSLSLHAIIVQTIYRNNTRSFTVLVR